MSYRVIDYSPSSVTLKIEDEQQEFYFSVPREFFDGFPDCKIGSRVLFDWEHYLVTSIQEFRNNTRSRLGAV